MDSEHRVSELWGDWGHLGLTPQPLSIPGPEVCPQFSLHSTLISKISRSLYQPRHQSISSPHPDHPPHLQQPCLQGPLQLQMKWRAKLNWYDLSNGSMKAPISSPHDTGRSGPRGEQAPGLLMFAFLRAPSRRIGDAFTSSMQARTSRLPVTLETRPEMKNKERKREKKKKTKKGGGEGRERWEWLRER